MNEIPLADMRFDPVFAAATLARPATEAAKYSPDQPRDERGRFGTTGGSGAPDGLARARYSGQPVQEFPPGPWGDPAKATGDGRRRTTGMRPDLGFGWESSRPPYDNALLHVVADAQWPGAKPQTATAEEIDRYAAAGERRFYRVTSEAGMARVLAGDLSYPDGTYGPGFYVADNPKDALMYAKEREGYGEKPVVMYGTIRADASTVSQSAFSAEGWGWTQGWPGTVAAMAGHDAMVCDGHTFNYIRVGRAGDEIMVFNPSAMRIAATPLPVHKYAPDQPRDERGRFASGGGSPQDEEAGPFGSTSALLTPGKFDTPRMTAAAFRSWARGAFPGMSCRGLPKLDERCLPSIQSALLQFRAAWPGLSGAVGTIDARSFRTDPALEYQRLIGRNTNAIGAYTVDKGGVSRVCFNTDLFGPKMYEVGVFGTITTSVANGWMAPGTPDNTIEGAVTHELGHVLFNALQDRVDQGTLAPERVAGFDAMRAAMSANFLGPNGVGGVERVSGYSARTPNESFAELYATVAQGREGATPTAGAFAAGYRQAQGQSSANKYSEDESRDDHGRWTAGASASDAIAATASAASAAMAGMKRSEMAQYVEQRTGTPVRLLGSRPVNAGAFREAMAQFVALHEHFPSVPVKAIEVAPIRSQTVIAQTEYSGYRPESTIRLAAGRWSYASGVLSGAKEGWFTPGNDNPAGYMTHEFGHALDQAALFTGQTLRPGDANYFRIGPFNSLPPISGYGATDAKEKFAELFAGTYASPSAPPDQQAAMRAYCEAITVPSSANKYSPDQPRGADGRWSSGGAGDDALERVGRMIDRQGKGNCYQAAYTLMRHADELGLKNPVICQATAVGRGGIKGRPFGHAWLEADHPAGIRVAYDFSSGNRAVLPADYYRSLGQVTGVHEYGPVEARVAAAGSGHYGPWR